MPKKKAKNNGQLPLPTLSEELEKIRGNLPAGMPTFAVLKVETARLGLPDTDAEALFDAWLASGFRLKDGRAIKDWKAALRNWLRNGWLLSQRKRSSKSHDEERIERRDKQFQKMKEKLDGGAH